MTDQTTPPPVTEEAPPAGETPPAGDGAPTGDGNDFDALPEWAKVELRSTRAEAGRYRTERNEAQAALTNAKTPEEVAAAIEQFKQRNEELERELIVGRVQAKYSLPDALIERLRGNTADEIEADAKALAALIPKAPEPLEPEFLGGGLNPLDGPDEGPSNPADIAKAYGRGRRRR